MIWFDLPYLALFAVIYLSLTCFVLVWFVLVGLIVFGLAYFDLLPSSVDKFVLALYHKEVLFIILLLYNTCVP